LPRGPFAVAFYDGNIAKPWKSSKSLVESSLRSGVSLPCTCLRLHQFTHAGVARAGKPWPAWTPCCNNSNGSRTHRSMQTPGNVSDLCSAPRSGHRRAAMKIG